MKMKTTFLLFIWGAYFSPIPCKQMSSTCPLFRENAYYNSKVAADLPCHNFRDRCSFSEQDWTTMHVWWRCLLDWKNSFCLFSFTHSCPFCFFKVVHPTPFLVLLNTTIYCFYPHSDSAGSDSLALCPTPPYPPWFPSSPSTNDCFH